MNDHQLKELRRSKDQLRKSLDFGQTHGNNLRTSKEEPLKTSKEFEHDVAYPQWLVQSKSAEDVRTVASPEEGSPLFEYLEDSKVQQILYADKSVL